MIRALSPTLPTVFALAALAVPASGAPREPVVVGPAPARVAGEAALSSAKKRPAFFSGSDAALMARLRQTEGFGALQDFRGFTGNAAGSRGFIVDQTAPAPDLRFTYGGPVTATALATNAAYATSVADGSALRLQAGQPRKAVTLTVEMGSWRDGAFRSDVTVRGVGFLLTGNYANFADREVVVRFLDAFGRELSRQTFSNDTSSASKAGADGPVSAFVGYLNPGNDPAANVGGVVIGFTAGVGEGPMILALDDFGTTSVSP